MAGRSGAVVVSNDSLPSMLDRSRKLVIHIK
jgi:hypothetical protein